jgi:hypothetical protein
MKISKRSLSILPGVAKTKENMYSLDHVKLDPENRCMWVSNGYSLYTTKLHIDDDDLTQESVHIPIKAILKAEKNCGKGIIDVSVNDNNVHLSTTDNEMVDVVKVKMDNNASFPDCKTIVNSLSEEPIDHVILAVSQLEILVKILKKHGDFSVRIETRGPEDAVRISTENDEIVGLIMPVAEGETK